MATVATPARQPFGILNEAKIRNLQSIKNRQNAIAPNSAPTLKRRAPSPELSDSENIDPGFFDSLNKRKRAAFEDDVSLCKSSRYTLNVVTSPSIKPRVSAPTVTPRVDNSSKPISSTPLSAPAAAGRSPARAANRGLQSRKRFAPPSIGGKSPSLSITAALNGTLAHKKAKAKKARTTIEETKPNSWFFDIFEESEEQQDYRMSEWSMTEQSKSLDLSGDEANTKELQEETDNKENVDPITHIPSSSVASSVSATLTFQPEIKQREAMSDEPRSPLGDLNPVEYYAQGLDATSVVLVHDDSDVVIPVAVDPQLPAAEETSAMSTPIIPTGECHAVAEEPQIEIPAWALRTSFSSISSTDSTHISNAFESADIEIWESESAKDENEKNETEFLGQSGHLSAMADENCAFAVQEL